MHKKYDKREYAKFLFSKGIEPFIQSLRKQGIVRKENILDVGCGAGQWTLAAAKLNPQASAIGVDIDKELFGFGTKYAREYDVENSVFLKASYESLLMLFRQESFDVILCNGVIQYVDEERAFKIFSVLLMKGGVLIMFYNHGSGYYLKRSFHGIKNCNTHQILSGAYVFSVGHLWKTASEHFIRLKRLQRVSEDVGIILERVESEPKLNYTDKFLGFTNVFSCKGIKIGGIVQHT